MDKGKEEFEDYRVPEKLANLYETRDYGRYGVDGTMPVCFIASNHTSGGNSGSPVLDAHGRLIGLNFDRNWEGTMSDVYYDPSLCRNIAVDIRYVLFIIDKFAGAGYLIDEMDISW
jgi:S1-C subfamily serine protease